MLVEPALLLYQPALKTDNLFYRIFQTSLTALIKNAACGIPSFIGGFWSSCCTPGSSKNFGNQIWVIPVKEMPIWWLFVILLRSGYHACLQCPC